MKKLWIFLFAFALFLPTTLSAQGFDIPGDNTPAAKAVEKVTSQFSHDFVRPGDTFALAVHVKVLKDHYIYSYNAKEVEKNLEPLKASVTKLPDGVSKVDILFTKPTLKYDDVWEKKIPVHKKYLYVYVVLKAKKNLKPADLKIEGKIDYLACNAKACLPAAVANFKGTIPAKAEGEPKKTNEKVFMERREVAVHLGWAEPVKTADGKDKKEKDGSKTAAKDSEKTDDSDTTTANTSDSGQGDQGKETPAIGSDTNKFQKLIDTYGFLVALLIALLWGILTAALPCVYPLIPITISYFSAQAKGSLATRSFMGLFYSLGIALSYAGLALIAKATGFNANDLIESPVFGWGLAIFFFVLSLSMFGLYELRLPSSITDKLQGSQKGGIFGAFFMGLVLGLIASPCVAGPAIAILIFVTQVGMFEAFVTMFAYGFGIGLPFMILAIFSSGVKSMPRAGEWMVTIKMVMGFVLVGAAVYFLQLGGHITDLTAAMSYGIVVLMTATFIGGFDRLEAEASHRTRFGKSFGVILIIVGAYLFGGGLLQSGLLLDPVKFGGPGFTAAGTSTQVAQIEWVKETEPILEPAKVAKEQNKNLFMFFTAKSCAYCQKMKKEVFPDPQLAAYVQKHFIPVYANASDDKLKAAVKKARDKFNVRAQPGFVFYNRSGTFIGQTGNFKTIKEFMVLLKKVVKSNDGSSEVKNKN